MILNNIFSFSYKFGSDWRRVKFLKNSRFNICQVKSNNISSYYLKYRCYKSSKKVNEQFLVAFKNNFADKLSLLTNYLDLNNSYTKILKFASPFKAAQSRKNNVFLNKNTNPVINDDKIDKNINSTSNEKNESKSYLYSTDLANNINKSSDKKKSLTLSSESVSLKSNCNEDVSTKIKDQKNLNISDTLVEQLPNYEENLTKSKSNLTLVEQVTSTANAAAVVVKNLSSYLPSLPYGESKKTETKTAVTTKNINIEKTIENLSKIDHDKKLIHNDLNNFCQYLIRNPQFNSTKLQKTIVPILLGLQSEEDKLIIDYSNCALRLVGFIKPLTHRGIRILSIDGGGTRGLMVIEILKKLEQLSGYRIHQLFDYICGVSTGALISLIISAFRPPLNEVESIYKTFSVKMFDRNKFIGAGKLFTSHAFYDTELWEEILNKNIGGKRFIETMCDPRCPKLAIVSSLVDTPTIQNFLFRNYVDPPQRLSHYLSTCDAYVWQSIRASSAAPGYFEEFQFDNHIHQDGGMLTNNPTAVALDECRMLWPDEQIQCVVSIGTGKHEQLNVTPQYKGNLKSKVTRFVESATDTEAVHRILHNLLPPNTYFRFNPYLSQAYNLDEVREDKWRDMYSDVEMYIRKNNPQMQVAVDQLVKPRSTINYANDYLREQLHKRNNNFFSVRF